MSVITSWCRPAASSASSRSPRARCSNSSSRRRHPRTVGVSSNSRRGLVAKSAYCLAEQLNAALGSADSDSPRGLVAPPGFGVDVDPNEAVPAALTPDPVGDRVPGAADGCCPGVSCVRISGGSRHMASSSASSGTGRPPASAKTPKDESLFAGRARAHARRRRPPRRWAEQRTSHGGSVSQSTPCLESHFSAPSVAPVPCDHTPS